MNKIEKNSIVSFPDYRCYNDNISDLFNGNYLDEDTPGIEPEFFCIAKGFRRSLERGTRDIICYMI